jgi:hypothetical protein
MANGVVRIVSMMAISKPKDGDLIEPEKAEKNPFVYPAPCGVMTESPFGTGQFNGQRPNQGWHGNH